MKHKEYLLPCKHMANHSSKILLQYLMFLVLQVSPVPPTEKSSVFLKGY